MEREYERVWSEYSITVLANERVWSEYSITVLAPWCQNTNRAPFAARMVPTALGCLFAHFAYMHTFRKHNQFRMKKTQLAAGLYVRDSGPAIEGPW
jgi:hypothetical protein